MSATLVAERPEPAVEPQLFRDAMRNLAGAVSLITAGTGPARSGLTVTSLSSFSIAPASIVTSINLTASAWPLIRREGRFSVQVLAADQADIASDFSGRTGLKGVDRFRNGHWSTFASTTPRLAGALVSLDCEIDAVFERHSHALLVGLVRDAIIGPAAPLLYFGAGFTSVGDLA